VTTDELCVWHAMREGWKLNVWVEGDAQWENRFTKVAQYEDPFPATLDGAAKAFPPDWVWLKELRESDGVAVWSAWPVKFTHVVEVLCTDDEINDRYMLAKLAWENKPCE